LLKSRIQKSGVRRKAGTKESGLSFSFLILIPALVERVQEAVSFVVVGHRILAFEVRSAVSGLEGAGFIFN
jgi:hypothetical protein